MSSQFNEVSFTQLDSSTPAKKARSTRKKTSKKTVKIEEKVKNLSKSSTRGKSPSRSKSPARKISSPARKTPSKSRKLKENIISKKESSIKNEVEVLSSKTPKTRKRSNSHSETGHQEKKKKIELTNLNQSTKSNESTISSPVEITENSKSWWSCNVM